MKRHEENGIAIASYLANQRKVKKVNYPGLPDHPQHALARRQMSGFGALISFELGSKRSVALFKGGILMERRRRWLAGGREQNRAHTAHSEDALAGCRRLLRDVAAQRALDSLLQQTASVDSHTQPRDPSASLTDGARHVEQDLRIGGTLTEHGQGHVVTGLLGGRGERALEPPRQGMKPQKAAIQVSEERDEQIAPVDMGDFVREHGAELLARPARPRHRKQNRRLQHANRNRRGDDV